MKNNDKQKSLKIGFFLALLALIAFWNDLNVPSFSRNGNEWETVTHEDYGFSIAVPRNWTVRTYGVRGSHNLHDLKLRINNDTSLLASEYVRVFWKYGENSTLEDTAVWGLETLPPHDETLRASPLQESTVGENYQALQRSYKWRHGGTSRVDYYVVNNNQAMMLVFQARDFSPDTEAVFDQMIASLRFDDNFIVDQRVRGLDDGQLQPTVSSPPMPISILWPLVGGFLLYFLPPWLLIDSEKRQPVSAFIEIYPHKKWLGIFLLWWPIIWFPLYTLGFMTFVFPFSSYLAIFLMGGSFAFIQAFFTLLTKVAVMYIPSRNSTISYLAYTTQSIRLAWIQILLFIAFGLIPAVFI